MSRLKERLQKKIEENAVKSELTWIDKQGNEKTEIVLLKRSRMPILGDWGRIYPPLDEEGNINWINLLFGGKKNLVKLLMVIAIVGMVLYQFYIAFNYIEYLRNLPCVQSCLESIAKTPDWGISI